LQGQKSTLQKNSFAEKPPQKNWQSIPILQYVNVFSSSTWYQDRDRARFLTFTA
jgi:hypothetical protein